MAKGAEAKQRIVNKFIEMFGKDWIGEYDKKYYIWSEENGERIQIAITMTCPKNPIEINRDTDVNEDWDWGNSSTIDQSVINKNSISAEITEEEKKNLAELMAKLGL